MSRFLGGLSGRRRCQSVDDVDRVQRAADSDHRRRDDVDYICDDDDGSSSLAETTAARRTDQHIDDEGPRPHDTAVSQHDYIDDETCSKGVDCHHRTMFSTPAAVISRATFYTILSLCFINK